jgi:hypothetical protein
MYSKFLTKFINEFSTEAQILNNYPEATDFDKCVILLRSMKFTYGQISSKMGSPSKKAIRTSLLKWTPELIEEDCNRNKLKAKVKVSKEEFELICLLKKLNILYPFYMGHPLLGHWRFMIVEGKLYYMEDDNSVWPFGDYDHVCQCQFLNIIKQQINEQKD